MNNSTTCESADYLAKNGQLHAMLIIRVIIAVCGLVLLAALLRFQGTYLSFHSNARVLMFSHHSWIVLQCVTSIVHHLFNLIRFASDNGLPCQYVVKTSLAVAIRGPSLFTTYGQVWSLVALAVERLFASNRYRNYESSDRLFGFCLLLLQWLFSSICLYIALRDTVLSELQAYPTVSSSKNSAIVSNIHFFLAAMEAISIIIFAGLRWYNRRKKALLTTAPLTEKYQIDENIRATQLMFPMIITHFCCFMPSLVILPIYLRIDPHVEPKNYTVFLETYSTTVLYCIFLPIVLFWRHKVLRQNLQNAFSANVISPDAPLDQHLTKHFQMLKDMWAK